MSPFSSQLMALMGSLRLANAMTVLIGLLLVWWLGAMAANALQTVEAPALPDWQLEESQADSVQGRPSFLYGDYKVALANERKPAPVDLNRLKTTRLNLKLMGVVDLTSRGAAIIETASGPQAVLEGEEIQSGVTLLDVYDTQAVISNRGVREKLVLNGMDNPLIATDSNDARANNRSSHDSPGLVEPSPRFAQISQQLRQSPMSISNYLRFEPINENGKWVGVRIWPKSDKVLFESLGFQDGDRVVSVNGKSIDELSKNPGLWQQFLAESQFDMMVERNGQTEAVSVQLSE